MVTVTATDLAAQLGVSKGRISQYVSEGKLNGCFSGEGRARRFDLAKSADALGKRLDPGQMLGNGANTQKALEDVGNGTPRARSPGTGATELPAEDPDRYKLARAEKVEHENRRLRRQNAMDEGTLVLTSEVALQVQRQLGNEISQFEKVMRDAAREIADELGVDFKVVRSILMKSWRAHRAKRADAIETATALADFTDAEAAEDI